MIGKDFSEGDRIVLTRAEHHANLIPWFQLAQRKKLQIAYLELDDNRNLVLDNINELLAPQQNSKYCSRLRYVLRTRFPVEMLCAEAKSEESLTLVDACQSAPHFAVNVQEIGCDFLVASVHKMYGPSGWASFTEELDLLRDMPPFLGGERWFEKWRMRDSYQQKFRTNLKGTPPLSVFLERDWQWISSRNRYETLARTRSRYFSMPESFRRDKRNSHSFPQKPTRTSLLRFRTEITTSFPIFERSWEYAFRWGIIVRNHCIPTFMLQQACDQATASTQPWGNSLCNNPQRRNSKQKIEHTKTSNPFLAQEE